MSNNLYHIVGPYGSYCHIERYYNNIYLWHCEFAFLTLQVFNMWLADTIAVYDILPLNGRSFNLCHVYGDVVHFVHVHKYTLVCIGSVIIFVDSCYSVLTNVCLSLAVKHKCTLLSVICTSCSHRWRKLSRQTLGKLWTPKDFHWNWKKRILGLKWVSCHWYNKISKILCNLNLLPCLNAQWIFKGDTIQDKPPLWDSMLMTF